MQAKTRKAFLEKHPLCCFCGGIELSTTIDHQPARVFFKGRRPPDDALFPACSRCQSVSRDAENAMSLLAFPVTPSSQDFAAWRIRAQSVSRNQPGYLDDVVPTPEMAREIRAQITAPPPVGYDEDDFIVLETERWKPHFAMIAKKLTLAMHYRYCGRPLSPAGKLVAMLVPNAQFDAQWDADCLSIYSREQPAKHGNQPLDDQFDVHQHVDEARQLMGVRLKLHEAMYVYGFSAEQTHALALRDISDKLDGPFVWPKIERETAL